MNDNDPYCPECHARHRGSCGRLIAQQVRISPQDSIESVIKKLSTIRPHSVVISSCENDETRGVIINFENKTFGRY